tara:strand:- start:21330 stop:21749 length:420 start_codon:yes stop_codon:yes gene_type:complete
MPNNTQNELTVCGKTKDVKSFVSHMGEDEFSFEKIIPMPENCVRGDLSLDLLKKCRAEGIPDWHEWSCENWGTKWDAYDVTFEPFVGCGKSGFVTYWFKTAWSPPFPVIKKVKELWPALEFSGGYVLEGYEGCGSWFDV